MITPLIRPLIPSVWRCTIFFFFSPAFLNSLLVFYVRKSVIPWSLLNFSIENTTMGLFYFPSVFCIACFDNWVVDKNSDLFICEQSFAPKTENQKISVSQRIWSLFYFQFYWYVLQMLAVDFSLTNCLQLHSSINKYSLWNRIYPPLLLTQNEIILHFVVHFNEFFMNSWLFHFQYSYL